eukprot:2705044-Pyramimonas_sp.AAC.1
MVLEGAGGALGQTMHCPMAFGDIMANTPKYMVSRQFAAMLQPPVVSDYGPCQRRSHIISAAGGDGGYQLTMYLGVSI